MVVEPPVLLGDLLEEDQDQQQGVDLHQQHDVRNTRQKVEIETSNLLQMNKDDYLEGNERGNVANDHGQRYSSCLEQTKREDLSFFPLLGQGLVAVLRVQELLAAIADPLQKPSPPQEHLRLAVGDSGTGG